MFPRIKEIYGFLQRYDFSAEHAQRVFQQNRPAVAGGGATPAIDPLLTVVTGAYRERNSSGKLKLF